MIVDQLVLCRLGFFHLRDSHLRHTTVAVAIGLAQHAETSQAVVVDFLQPVAHQEKHAQRQSHRDRNRENRPEDGGDCGMHDTVRRNNACTVRGGAGFGEREGCAQRLEVRQCGA